MVINFKICRISRVVQTSNQKKKKKKNIEAGEEN
jgi:hypothetical protein